MVSREALQGLTVLVIDDHYDTVDMLVQYLRFEGAIAVGVRSARVAMTCAADTRFDAVLVDLRMPDGDGRWFLQELRSSGASSAHAPVFAVSGDRADESGQADGFAGYFLKPVAFDALIAKLQTLPRQKSDVSTA
jgi:DNA-binding response OmpR family regulator